jgi:hypothetical protein
MGFFRCGEPNRQQNPYAEPKARRRLLRPRTRDGRHLRPDDQPASLTFTLFLRDLQRLRREQRMQRQTWRNLLSYLQQQWKIKDPD